MSHLAMSVAVYSLVCATSVLFGATILSWLRLGLSRSLRLLLAPAVTGAFWVLALSTGIRIGFAVRAFAPWIAGFTFLVVLLGAWRHARSGRAAVPPSGRLVLAAVLLAPVVALAPAFWHGLDAYFHHTFLDSWLNAVSGRLAWSQPYRDPSLEGLPFVDLLAAKNWTWNRVAGPALQACLGFFYEEGDPRAGANLYIAHSVLILAGALAAWVWTLTRRAWIAIAAAILAGGLRWVGDMIHLGNHDHLLAVAFLPACLFLASLPGRIRWGGALVLGGCIAAAGTAYPEAILFILGPVGAALGWACLHRSDRAKRLGYAAATLAASVLLFHVEVRMVANNLHIQFSNAMTAGIQDRPGGLAMSGLLGPSAGPAFLGMGNEWTDPLEPLPRKEVRLRRVVAAMLALAVLLGSAAAFRRGRWDLPFIVGCLLAGSLYFLLGHRYPYAAYKLLAFAQPVILVLFSLGTAVCLRLRPVLRIPLLGAFLPPALFLFAPCWMWGSCPESNLAGRTTRPLAEFARKVKQATGGQPLLLFVEDVATNTWLEYYLGSQPVTNPYSFLGPLEVQSGIKRPAWKDARYLLTAREGYPGECGLGWEKVLESDGFGLWRFDPERGALLLTRWSESFDNPERGLALPRETWRWCRTPEATVTLQNHSSSLVPVELRFRVKVLQKEKAPLTIGFLGRSMTVEASPEGAEVVLPLSLPVGETTITFRTTAAPVATPGRKLTFGIFDFAISFPGDRPLVRQPAR